MIRGPERKKWAGNEIQFLDREARDFLLHWPERLLYGALFLLLPIVILGIIGLPTSGEAIDVATVIGLVILEIGILFLWYEKMRFRGTVFCDRSIFYESNVPSISKWLFGREIPISDILSVIPDEEDRLKMAIKLAGKRNTFIYIQASCTDLDRLYGENFWKVAQTEGE